MHPARDDLALNLEHAHLGGERIMPLHHDDVLLPQLCHLLLDDDQRAESIERVAARALGLFCVVIARGA